MHLFLDASGDDGSSFSDSPGQGSSRGYTVAILCVDDGNLMAARKVMLDVKKDAGLRPTDELKHSKVRYTARWPRVKEGLQALPVRVFVTHIQKDRLDSTDNMLDTSQRLMAGAGHTLLIERAFTSTDATPPHLVVDRMKESEQWLIQTFLKTPTHAFPEHTIQFKDSKSESLLQAADIWAGVFRYAWEDYFRNHSTQPCAVCLTRSSPLCVHKRQRKPHPVLGLLEPFANKLEVGSSGRASGHSFWIVPRRIDMYMLDCLGFDRGKWAKRKQPSG